MNQKRLTRVGCLLVVVFVLVNGGASAATPAGFGNGGYVAWWGGAPSGLGVQRSGRIVVSSGWSVSAWTSSGARDRRFESNDVSPGVECANYCPVDLALQRDDRIVLAGQHTVLRLMPDGALDASFGTGGRVSVPGIFIQSAALTPE